MPFRLQQCKGHTSCRACTSCATFSNSLALLYARTKMWATGPKVRWREAGSSSQSSSCSALMAQTWPRVA